MDEMSVNLNDSRWEHGTLKTHTGLQWAQIYKELENYKRVVVGGNAHTVTPGGYTQGGGHSPLSRSLGYAVDNLFEVQIVLSDGRVATCSDTTTVIMEITGQESVVNDGDLFWALRGGGGGTYGVVVYYVFKLHPMPDQMVVMRAIIPLVIPLLSVDHTEAALTALGEVIATLPSEWGGYWMIDNFPGVISNSTTGLGYDLPYKGGLTLFMNKLGKWAGTESTVFEKLLAFTIPKKNPVSFANKTSFWDYEKDVYDPPILRAYIYNSLLQLGKLDEKFVSYMKSSLFNDTKGAYIGCIGILLGGNTTTPSLASTPLHPGYRTTITCLTCGIILSDAALPLLNQTAHNDVLIEKADTLAEDLKEFGSGQYLNEPAKNNPDWKQDYWGDNYDRLLEIKLRYDPDNFLTCVHCVGSDMYTASQSTESAATLPLFDLYLILVVIATRI